MILHYLHEGTLGCFRCWFAPLWCSGLPFMMVFDILELYSSCYIHNPLPTLFVCYVHERFSRFCGDNSVCRQFIIAFPLSPSLLWVREKETGTRQNSYMVIETSVTICPYIIQVSGYDCRLVWRVFHRCILCHLCCVIIVWIDFEFDILFYTSDTKWRTKDIWSSSRIWSLYEYCYWWCCGREI